MNVSSSFLLTSIPKMTVLASLLIGAAWLTPARAASRKSAPEDVRAAVSTAWKEHIDAARRKDLEDVMEIYTDDVVYVVSGAEEVRGWAALEKMEAQTLETADVLDAVHTVENLSVFGDVAYEIGVVAGSIRQQGEEAVKVSFHFMARWQRQANGAWRIQYMVGQAE